MRPLPLPLNWGNWMHQFEPKVLISAMGEGIAGTKIIGELQKIDTNIQPLTAEQIIQKYHNFANSIIEVNGQKNLYQQAVKREVNNVLKSDVLELNQLDIENLKKLNFVPEILSEVVLNKIILQ